MIKRILSVLLIISTVFSFAVSANAKSAESFPAEDKIEILKALDMINEEYDELTIDNSKIFTKAEYAYLAASVLAKGITSDALYFHDLQRENWACSYVSVLVEQNILPVNSERYFYPVEQMSIEKAMEMSLRALGYSTLLESQTVSSLAQSTGISKGVIMSDGLNFQNAVVILYNTLFSNVMEFKGNSFEQSDKTFLEYRYSIIFKEGILECVNGVSVTAEYENDNTYISGEEFELTELGIYDLLGSKISYLYKYDEKQDTRNLIWVKKAKNNDEVLKLMYVENEISFNRQTYELTYYDGKKYKKINLDKDIDVVFNDKYVISGVEEILSGEMYSLQLIERNGEYKCLIVKSYENYVAGAINSVEEIIYDEVSGKSLEIDKADELCIKNADGKELAFEDIKINDVLSVYQSLNGERLEIIVSENNVSGAVSEIKTDDYGCQNFTIDGKTYRKAKADDFESLLIGSEVVLYLDAYGYVAYVDSNGNADILAYMIKPYYDDSEEKLFIRMYDRSGKIMNAECDTRLKINREKTYKDVLKVYSRLQSYGHGLIIYKKNSEGLINSITLASNDGSSDLRLRFSKETQRYRSTGSRLGQKMCLDNNTIIFGIPGDPVNATEDEFTVTTKAGLYGDMNYIVESYAYSEKVGYEQVLLIYENDWNYKHGNTVGILVTGTSSCLNDEGEVVDCIIGWQGSQKVEKLCHESLSAADAKIGKGDYITFNENKKGEIVSINVNYDLSEGRRPKARDMHVIEALSSGYVHEVNGNVATVGIESGADFDMAYDFAAGTVLIYDSRHNEVSAGSAKDLISYDVAGENCDFLLTHMRYSKQLVYIIYR